MGAAESRQNTSQILQVFTPEEQQNIHRLYVEIIGSQKSLTGPFLQKYFPPWVEPGIKNVIFSAICKCARQSGAADARHVTELLFGEFLALLLKGTYTEKTTLLCLMNGGEIDFAHLGNLVETVHAIVRMFLQVTSKDQASSTWKVHTEGADIQAAAHFLMDLTPTEIEGLPAGKRLQDEVESWISKSPLFLKMFDRVFNEMFPVLLKETRANLLKSLMPAVTDVDWNRTMTVLNPISVIFINYHLPTEQQREWRLLFSNILHGDSFSQLTRFSCDKGPNVFVVRDKDGYVFGAYVTESWETRPQFYGSPECFLFTLKPHFGIYTTTGYNSNYMYLNQGQETMPNGMGLGGQLEYFGLWIDSTFNSGHSRAKPKCTTFGSPQLSKQAEFKVDTLEIWGVGPEKKAQDSDDDEYTKKSILDKDLGAKAILEMAGKKSHSEGLRELGEDEATMTDEMKRKMNTIPKLL